MAAVDASIPLHSYALEQKLPTKVILIHEIRTILFRRETRSRTTCLSFKYSQRLLCLFLFLSPIVCSTGTHRSFHSITSLGGSGHPFPCCSESLLDVLYCTWDFVLRFARKRKCLADKCCLLDNAEYYLQTVATFNQHTCPWFQDTIAIHCKSATKFLLR